MRQAHASARFRRADKPNPLYYAQRTVDIASARLALLAGASIHDVITILKHAVRLSFPPHFAPLVRERLLIQRPR